MPTWAKVLLVVLVVGALLLAGAVGFGVYLLRKHGPEFIENGKHAMDEGTEYGRTTDNEGCVAEAVARHKRAQGFGDKIRANLFLGPCLQSSRPVPGFCDDVPKQLEVIRTARWQLQQCQHYGLSPENQCGQLFQPVQQFCTLRGEGAH